MTDGLEDQERARITSEKIVLYHSPYCGYSCRALELLRRKGHEPQVVVALGKPALRSWLLGATGQRTLPQVFISGRSIGGYSELLSLELDGNLEPLLSTED